MTHELKILPKYYNEIVQGKKNFEIRKNDRDFKVGDVVILKEFVNGDCTGNYIKVIIDYVFHNEGYCVFHYQNIY